jgi:hypothetical protein
MAALFTSVFSVHLTEKQMKRYSELEHERARNNVAKMAAVRNFEVMSDRRSIMRMCDSESSARIWFAKLCNS